MNFAKVTEIDVHVSALVGIRASFRIKHVPETRGAKRGLSSKRDALASRGNK